MSRRLFADTSGLYALAAQENQRHKPALLLLQSASILITTRLVLLETVSLITKRRSAWEAKRWYDQFHASSSVTIREHEPKLFRQTEEFWRKHDDKDWDLIDCYSFVTYDRHFRQAGFRIIEED